MSSSFIAFDPSLVFALLSLTLFAISLFLYSTFIHPTSSTTSSTNNETEKSPTKKSRNSPTTSQEPDHENKYDLRERSPEPVFDSDEESAEVNRRAFDENNFEQDHDNEWLREQHQMPTRKQSARPSSASTSPSSKAALVTPNPDSANINNNTSIFGFLLSSIKFIITLSILIFVRLPFRHGIVFVASSILGIWCLFQHDDLLFVSGFSFLLFCCFNYFIKNNEGNRTHQQPDFLVPESARSKRKFILLALWMSFVYGNISNYVLDSFMNWTNPHVLLANVASLHESGGNKNICSPFASASNSLISKNIHLVNISSSSLSSSSSSCLNSFTLHRKFESLDGRLLHPNSSLNFCRDSSSKENNKNNNIVTIAGDSIKISHLTLSGADQVIILGENVIFENVTIKTSGSKFNSGSSFLTISESSAETLILKNVQIVANIYSSTGEGEVQKILIDTKKSLPERKNSKRKVFQKDLLQNAVSNKFSFLFEMMNLVQEYDVQNGHEDEDHKKITTAEEENNQQNHHDEEQQPNKLLLQRYFDTKSFHNVLSLSTYSLIQIVSSSNAEENDRFRQDLWMCSSYPKRLRLFIPVAARMLRSTAQTMFPLLTCFIEDALIPATRKGWDILVELSANVGCGILDVHAHHKNIQRMHEQQQQQELQRQESTGVSLVDDDDNIIDKIPKTLLLHLPPQDQKRIITFIASARAVECLGRKNNHQQQEQEINSSKTPQQIPFSAAVNNNINNIIVSYDSSIRSVFRELCITFSWLATSVGWRIISWCWNKEVEITFFLMDVMSCLLTPVWYLLHFFIVDFLHEVCLVKLMCGAVILCSPAAESIMTADDSFFQQNNNINNNSKNPPLIALYISQAFSLLSDYSASCFTHLVFPVVSCVASWGLQIVLYFGRYYFAYVNWAREMEMIIYAELWSPVKEVLYFTLQFIFNLVFGFVKATFDVSFKIHVLMSVGQISGLIYSVWYAFKVRQYRKQQHQVDMVLLINRRRHQEQQEDERKKVKDMEGNNNNNNAHDDTAGTTNKNSSFLSGLWKNLSGVAVSQGSKMMTKLTTSASTTASKAILLANNNNNNNSESGATSSSTPNNNTLISDVVSAISFQHKTRNLFSHWYDQAQTIFSAKLWSLCLEVVIYWACAMFLRFVPLPIGMINAFFEGYVFPVMTSTEFGNVFRTEQETIREKHISALMDEEIEKFNHEEINENRSIRRSNLLFSHLEQKVLDEEATLADRDANSYWKYFVSNFYASKDWKIVLVTRFVVAVVLETLFGGVLDFVYEQVAQAVKLALLFGFLFVLFKLYQFWSTIKSFIGGGKVANNNDAERRQDSASEIGAPQQVPLEARTE